MIARAALLLVCAGTCLASVPALAACGDKEGPGYRGPNGKCVGWAQIGRVCGSPPDTRCTAENVQAGADTASDKGQEIEKLRLAPKEKSK